MSKILVISTSLRAKSNSDILTERLIAGAKDAGHEVEHISLKGKDLKFCIGCLACQKTQKCVLKDDAVWIAEKVKNADTLVFTTPIYYYEMSGQMKTLLDRMNPLYPSDYKFRRVYMLSVATEDEEYVPEKAVSGLQGWVDCFETWIPGTHNYGIRYFPTSGVASKGVTPRSRYICSCFFRTSP